MREQVLVATTNGIVLTVPASAGLHHAGRAWLEVPDGGVPADLLPQVRRYLAAHEDKHRLEECLEVQEVSWEGVRKAVEVQLARRADRAVVEAMMESQVVEAWRAQAAAYMLGEEAVAEPLVDRGACAFHGLPDRRVYGKIAGQVTDGEIAAVRAEKARREEVLQERRKEWAIKVGMSDDMVERLLAGVMPEEELTEVVVNALVPELGAVSELQVSELGGVSFKRHHRCGSLTVPQVVDVVGEVVEVGGIPMRSLEWKLLKELRAVVERVSSQAQVIARVVLVQYQETLKCGCKPLYGYMVSLHLELLQVGLKVVRTYGITPCFTHSIQF